MLRDDEEGGEDFAGFAGEGFVEDVAIGRRFGADVVSFGVASGVSGETGGRLDGTGGADGKEDGATIECGVDVVEIVRHFAEPADVRANLRTTFAAWNGGRRLVEVRIFEGRARTRFAAGLEEFAVHVDDAR